MTQKKICNRTRRESYNFTFKISLMLLDNSFVFYLGGNTFSLCLLTESDKKRISRSYLSSAENV